MPVVELDRGIRQALLIRLYERGIRLSVDEGKYEEEDSGKPIDGIKVRRAKGTDAKLSREEKSLIHEHEPQLVHMLRFDFEYGMELVRVVRKQTMQAYPIARGCDLSPQHELIDKAVSRLEKRDMHALWYYLDDALRLGLELCEEYRDRPVLEEEVSG